MVSLRGIDQWDESHKALVLAALERTQKEGAASGHVHAINSDLQRGYNRILDGLVGAVIVDDEYLIVYDVGATFYSPSLVLFEVLVTRIKGVVGSFRVIPAALEALAKYHGCSLIVSGNSTGRQGISRVYRRAGFSQSAIQFFKEVP